MPFLALLKLIPLKDFGYLAIVLAVVGAFAWTYHKGEVRIEAKDAALRAAAVALNKASENLADIKEIQLERTYTHIVDSSAIASTGLVCHNAAAPAEPLAAGNERPAANAASGAVPTGSFDPSGPILTLLRDSDAQVNALISKVYLLEDELEGKTK
jgi:hypothetical protein